MKKLQNIIILSACWIVLGVSCKDSGSEKSTENDSPRIIKATKLISPKSNATYTIGDTVEFQLESTGAEIDSVSFQYNDYEKVFTTAAFSWSPEQTKTGKQKVRLKVYCGASSETHYSTLTFFSDVVPEEYTYEVIKTYAHDPKAYTQGFFFKDDTLIESTGQRGTSWLTKLNLETLETYDRLDLDNDYFGEGSCYWNNKYIYLTYTSNIGFVFDNNFNETRTFNYTYQGWGITVWGDTLYVSDGTNVIHKLDPRDFSEIGSLEVYDQEDKISEINELEMIDGLLYANIYQEDYIVVIDPLTGKLLRRIDMAGLLTPLEARKTDVINGIAYHSGRKSIYITGKLWPTIFEVKFLPK